MIEHIILFQPITTASDDQGTNQGTEKDAAGVKCAGRGKTHVHVFDYLSNRCFKQSPALLVSLLNLRSIIQSWVICVIVKSA